MNTFKRAKVVMLPTEKGVIAKRLEDGILKEFNITSDKYFESQHLYIISDDEIKEGDWFYDTNSKLIDKAINSEVLNLYPAEYKKIVATTDSSLKLTDKRKGITYTESLPQPSQSFIEKYIESYNNGNPIIDVMVEYEEKYDGKSMVIDMHSVNQVLKVNPKDNTITIKKVKDSYTKEEVIILLKEMYQDASQPDDGFYKHYDSFDQWLQDNL